METRNVNGDVLSNEVFKEKEELVKAFADELENKEVKTIEVTKDITTNYVISDTRKNYINKKIRKLNRKLAEYKSELS